MQRFGKVHVPIEGLFCNYSHRICMQNRVDGSEYCIRHILEDKNSSYKQCSYVSSANNKRCPNAAPKSDKRDGYCLEHGRRASLMRQRAVRQCKPADTPETILENLSQYQVKTNTAEEGGGDAAFTLKKLEQASVLASSSSKILDYASDSDSDQELPLVDQTYRGDGDSDAESIDSEQEDPLKHAGVYTAEEVALITRDKLIRLQSLYIDQFKRLQHLLKEKRRRYLQALRNEKGVLGSEHNVVPSTLQEQKLYNKLHALKRYHKRHGREAVLHRKSKERRIAHSEGASYKPQILPKCEHKENSLACNETAIPLTRFCSAHICNDPKQVLYQPCKHGEPPCSKPLIYLSENAACLFHTRLPGFKDRLQLDESDADVGHSETVINVDKSDSEDKVKHEHTITGDSDELSMTLLQQQKYSEECPLLEITSETYQQDMTASFGVPTPSCSNLDTELLQSVTTPSDRPGSPLLDTDSKEDSEVNVMSPETDIDK